MTAAILPPDANRPAVDALLDELGALPAVASVLDVVCRTTGMGFAAVAHVTQDRWVAAQVQDEIGFGLPAGGELPVKSTLCDTVRGTRRSIVIDEVASDPVYRDHHTPATYGLQSYIAVPIVLNDGELFGTLCAIDPAPHKVDTPQIRGMFDLFAQLIATHVDRIRSAAQARDLEQQVMEVAAERKVYADIVESSRAATTALDLDGRVLAINRANIEAHDLVFGRHPNVGDDFFALFEDPENLAQQRAIWDRALTGETFIMTGAFGDEEIGKRHYEVRFAPLLDSSGQRIGASSTSYDITARVQAEEQLALAQEQLRQSQKMEAMGQLTGGVAHDFNNLLTPIIGSLDLLERSMTGERDQRLVAAAMESAERARTLVQRLLAFARRQPLQAGAVDLGALVEGMASLIAGAIGPRIRLDLDIAARLPAAHADANQIEVALLNLAVNARDAMNDGGTLTIALRSDAAGAGHPAGLAPGGYLRLTIADTGAGMDPATLARAIEPFFSTKGLGKGTGLGLSMVDGLARQLGGALAIDSLVGAGTTITLWLPRSVGASAPAETPAPAAASADHAGLVLVVDDEALVRLSTAEMVGDLGYRVVEADSANAALSLIRDGLKPDIVLTDHLMPGMTGADLAITLQAEQPDIPVLIISGYADIDGIAPGLARLTKPFRQHELTRRLAEVRR